MPICFNTNDINLDCSVRMVSSTVLYCKVTIFPFGIDKNLERYLETMLIPCFFSLLLTNFRIYWWILPTTIISSVCPMVT